MKRVITYSKRGAKMGALLAAGVTGALLAAASGGAAALAQDGTAPAMRMTNSIVLTGTVAGDPAGGAMVVRARNGITYQVRPHGGVNVTRIRGGDRVRVFGNLRGQVLEGAGVRVLRRRYSSSPSDYGGSDPWRRSNGRNMNGASNTGSMGTVRRRGPYLTLTGTVTSNPSGDRFTMRARNGVTYPVRALWGEPMSVSAGDRVRVYGAWHAGMLHASNVRILRQGRNPHNYNAHTLTGSVTNDLEGDRFVLRAGGTTYRVLAAWGEPDTLSEGDRVRAYGNCMNGMLHASNVRVLREGRVSRTDTGGRSDTSARADVPVADANMANAPRSVLDVPAAARGESGGGNISLTGNVTVNPDGNEFYIRDISGYSHRVRALWGEPANLRVGARVRLYGNWMNGMLYAANVRVLR